MKIGIKSFAAVAVIAVLGATSAFAAGGIKSAQYNSNKVVFDGKELDLSANPMLSVVKEGETDASNYMPLRGVLEQMGYTVDWDGATKTVIISSPSSGAAAAEEDYAKKLVGYWISDDESALMKCHFTEDGKYQWQTTEKQATPPVTSLETGTFVMEQERFLAMKGTTENGGAVEHTYGIGFIDDDSWGYGHGTSSRTFVRDTGDTSWADGAGATANMPNPWNTCTEQEAFEYLGATFKIEPPAGYTLSEVAALSEQYAEESGKSARFVYRNNKDEMFRVHITPDAAGEIASQGEPVKANGIDAYYNKDGSSVSYAQESYVVSIDMLEKSKDELLKTVGSVTLVK